MKKLSNRKNKGFTLIEVIVAVSIVIILSALAIPKVSGYLSKAKEAKTMSMGKQIFTAAMWSYADNNSSFDKEKVANAVSNTTNVSLSSTDITPNDAGKSVTINFSNDSKVYVLSIEKDTNNYTIKGIANDTLVFSSTQ